MSGRGGLLLAVGLGVAGFLIFQYGRSVWVPAMQKLRGKQTIDSVVQRLTPRVQPIFDTAGYRGGELLILAAKQEQRLDVLERRDGEWAVIWAAAFTGFSGTLGPKLREGDGQIPEGMYKVEYLNPNSSYHLSFKLGYPNAFDRDRGQADGRERLGSDIFIHGKTQTIGCIPLGDERIEELFWLVATAGMDQVEVIIMPWDFRVRATNPEIADVAWSPELYAKIRARLVALKL